MRVYYHGELVNLHLITIPMFERHSAKNIFNLIAKFMDVLYIKWRAKLIGMLSNDENTMTSRHAGVFTRIVACVENKVLCIWCALHQMDIVVKAATEGIDDGIWVKFAYTYFVYLRAQENLIINMNVKCSKKTNGWVHLGRLLNFFKSYHRSILEHTKAKHPDMMPTEQWWVITQAVTPAINSIIVAFVEL